MLLVNQNCCHPPRQTDVVMKVLRSWSQLEVSELPWPALTSFIYSDFRPPGSITSPYVEQLLHHRSHNMIIFEHDERNTSLIQDDQKVTVQSGKK
jgi:hypothetical protein